MKNHDTNLAPPELQALLPRWVEAAKGGHEDEVEQEIIREATKQSSAFVEAIATLEKRIAQ